MRAWIRGGLTIFFPTAAAAGLGWALHAHEGGGCMFTWPDIPLIFSFFYGFWGFLLGLFLTPADLGTQTAVQKSELPSAETNPADYLLRPSFPSDANKETLLRAAGSGSAEPLGSSHRTTEGN
jgi:hypothetical protein